MEKGRFITLEGIDGAGKTTHVNWLADWLRGKGKTVLATREPGGTAVGERIRELLLRQRMGADTEVLLLFAARCEHLRSVILPALEAGIWVVCDRFTDATMAYQGGGRGIPTERLAVLERWVQGDFQPDLTIFFDVPVAISLERLRDSRDPDRFEGEKSAFFEQVRAAYLSRMAQFSQRIRLVDAEKSVDEVRISLEELLTSNCPI